MPRQKGLFKVKGTMDDISFYQSKDGHMVRQKGNLTKERVATDPKFTRTRENGAEFGRAGSAVKLLRLSLRSLILKAGDDRLTSRLMKAMMVVVKSDKTSVRGARNVIDGEAELLQGFEFNINGLLSTTLFANYVASIDRAGGQLKIDLPAFVPAVMLAAPQGATHFSLFSGGASIDFEKGLFTGDTKSTEALPLNNVATAAISLVHTVEPNSVHPLFLALGVEFFQEVNGQQYPLSNGAFNALRLVKVSGV